METLKINSALATLSNKRVSKEQREELVHEGACLVLERIGREKNKALAKLNRPAEDFGSAFKSNSDFEKYAAKWSDDVLCYCAKKANDFNDKNTDRNDRSTYTSGNLAVDPMFLKPLASVMREVLHTVTPYLVSEIVGEMASVVTVPKGQTYTVGITSNAVIQWSDASWTSLRSVPEDRLYNHTITLNPRPIAAKFSINFYQMVGNGLNMIDTLAAVAGGYAAKIMEKFTTAFTAAAADSRYVPSALHATGYSDANWASLTQNVAKANRVRRDQLIAYGDFLALRKVLPDNASLASAIMMQLGEEYFKQGYLMSHDGVMLYEITPTATPTTINTTLQSIFPTDTIIVAARANGRYAPMIAAFEEGADTQLDLTPGDATLATGRIEGLQVASLDIAPAFASRIGIMDSIV